MIVESSKKELFSMQLTLLEELTIQKLIQGECASPHEFLGLHLVSNGKKKIIRLWRPGALEIFIQFQGNIVSMKKMHPAGLFVYPCEISTQASDYLVFSDRGGLQRDPYTFLPTFGAMDEHLFARGVHYEIDRSLGVRKAVCEGISGIKCATWAPNALGVAIVGDFNFWNGNKHPMRQLGGCGVWEIFIPSIEAGEKYKFEIHTKAQKVVIKADPYAYYGEHRPQTASIVWDVETFPWSDEVWMSQRKEYFGSKPMNIYEMHLGSWKRRDGINYRYKELAPLIASYCLEMGYTHIEILPVLEHPLDESWGYQVTGFYAVTSRYGNPSEFQYFVNYLHKNNIGVILDWVPAHFPTDEFALSDFDGSSLYEHQDPSKKIHPHWNTHVFNYARNEVSNFLIGSALFWIGKMHIDGLRVDAVASMLYLDYGKTDGQWQSNKYGGNENIEAIEFLKHLNSIVHEKYPGALMVAEESSAFTGVTHDLLYGGLGFDMKWNMGWMNDTLRYFSLAPIFRKYHQNDFTFSFMYQYSEKFTLVLSHDEVVHGKCSLVSKMPGDDWQKFAGLRVLLSYMICHPGKKLLFMGGEIAQWNEWSEAKELDWFLLAYDNHKKFHHFVRTLNHFYLKSKALWQWDFDSRGFDCIHVSDHENSVIGYLRKAEHDHLLCVHHTNINYLDDYVIPLANVHNLKEVLNSDSEEFGGSGKINPSPRIIRSESGQPIAIAFRLAPLATMIFEVHFESGPPS